MPTAPHVVDLGGAHAVLVPSWKTHNGHLSYYCGEEKFNGIPSGTDLYILCHDQARADEMLRALQDKPFFVAHAIATGRRRIYGPIVQDLLNAGHAAVADTYGPACDDERMKALHTPPAGPDLEFIWYPEEKLHRLRCAVLRRNGTTGFDKTILRPSSEDPEGDVARAYAKYAKRGPVSIGGLRCQAHVAAKLERIDGPAAKGLKAWRAAMEKAGLPAHQELPPLRIPAAAMREPGDLEWIEISGMRDSTLVRAKCRYVGGTTIDQTTLTLAAAVPETMALGMIGLQLSRIWGDDDLSTLVLEKEASTSTPEVRAYTLSGPTVAFPDIEGNATGIADGSALTSAEFADLRIDAIVGGILSRMEPADLVHVLRSIRTASDNGSNGRLDVSPWVPGAKGRMWLTLATNIVAYSGADMIDMSDFLNGQSHEKKDG